MQNPDEGGPAGDELDPDAVLWVPGVDYVGGWRDAESAAKELSDALASAGVDTEGIRLCVGTSADGSGVIQLRCLEDAAQDIALLVRVAATRPQRAG